MTVADFSNELVDLILYLKKQSLVLEKFYIPFYRFNEFMNALFSVCATIQMIGCYYGMVSVLFGYLAVSVWKYSQDTI